jgi:5'-nucleotidase
MTAILLTNDDGIQSPGLALLRRVLDPLGEVVTYAPGDNQSAVARGMTIDRALHARPTRFGGSFEGYAVDGTPVDCVRLAMLGLRASAPDWVVAGVNLGGNMGDDVTYSGTVGAALEAALRGVPAVAVSVESRSPGHLDEAEGLLRHIVALALVRGLPPKTVLNINLPDRPLEAMRGVRLARLGGASCHDRIFVAGEDGGRSEFRIVCARPPEPSWPQTDLEAVAEGYVAPTPLRMDLVDEAALAAMSDWGLEELPAPSAALEPAGRDEQS